MKIFKSAVFAVFFVLAAVGYNVVNAQTVLAPTITVTAPAGAAGGQLIAAGGTYIIRWTSTDVSNVNLYLCSYFGSCQMLNGPSSNVPASQDSFSWYVDPNNLQFPGGNFQIKVTDVASDISGVSGYFGVTGGVTLPTITQITPGSGTGNTAITVYGTNLTGATEVDFYNSNNQEVAGIVQQNFAVASGGQSINFALSGAFGGMVAAGNYQVKVVTPTGVSNGVSFSFTPTASNAPTITQITPGSGTGNTAITVYGTNLTGATEVDFYNSNNQEVAGINNSVQQDITVVPGGQSLNFALSGAFGGMVAAGNYQVKVVTPAGVSNGVSFSFTPTASNAPTITQITPGSGTGNTAITVYGTNLTGATEVDFYNSNNQEVAGINNSVQQDITVVPGGQSLNFALSGAFGGMVAAGNYQVKVVTPTGVSNGVSFSFIPTAANAPMITSVAPITVTPGATMYVYGVNYGASTYVAIDGAGSIVPAIAPLGTSLSFVVPSTISVGIHTVEVGNKGGSAPDSNRVSFTVQGMASYTGPISPQSLVISYINPTSASPSTVVYVYGGNFDYGTYVSWDGVQSINPNSYTNSTLSFTVPQGASAGSHTIQVAEKASAAVSNTVTLNVIAPSTATGGSGSGSQSLQAMQQELTQLLTLLLQLLQQAAAQGILSPSQLNAALNSVSH